MLKTAVISDDDGVYRYELTRRWAEGPVACWVMLNPSTADADIDDPTIRRCIGFTQSWEEGGRGLEFGGLRVVNLFAFRATKPRKLRSVVDPIGPLNWRYVADAIEDPTTNLVVVAWGSSAPPRCPTVSDVVLAASRAGHRTRCLGTTKAGYPRHPLYVRADQPLEDWPRKDQP